MTYPREWDEPAGAEPERGDDIPGGYDEWRLATPEDEDDGDGPRGHYVYDAPPHTLCEMVIGGGERCGLPWAHQRQGIRCRRRA